MNQSEKQYPFNEGDDYWTIQDGKAVKSCWDTISEEMHDQHPDRLVFASEVEAIAAIYPLEPRYYIFGNKGACWENAVHIARGSDSATMCGTPMLSTNWARIWGFGVGCEKCKALYEQEPKMPPHELARHEIAKLIGKMNTGGQEILKGNFYVQGRPVFEVMQEHIDKAKLLYPTAYPVYEDAIPVDNMMLNKYLKSEK